jgi:hypothetical protein
MRDVGCDDETLAHRCKRSARELGFNFEKMRKNGCGVVFLVSRDIDDGCAVDRPESVKAGPEACRTDSESVFWQQKNFSLMAPSRLINARQAPISARIDWGRFATSPPHECCRSSNIVNEG